MKVTLHVWRQAGPTAPGRFVRYDMTDVSPDMSFLEMLDVLNQQLIARREEPIAFDHDCREGICGACGMVINGRPHGPQRATTACQLHMRTFPDGADLWIEPWRARAFPLIKDLVAQMDAEGFGACTNHGECMAACPKEISIDFIARMNRDYIKAAISHRQG